MAEKTCANPECKKGFTTRFKRQIYCSERCSRRAYRISLRQPLAKCANPACGKEFQPERGNHIFCTPQCGQNYRRAMGESTDHIMSKKDFNPLYSETFIESEAKRRARRLAARERGEKI